MKLESLVWLVVDVMELGPAEPCILASSQRQSRSTTEVNIKHLPHTHTNKIIGRYIHTTQPPNSSKHNWNSDSRPIKPALASPHSQRRSRIKYDIAQSLANTRDHTAEHIWDWGSLCAPRVIRVISPSTPQHGSVRGCERSPSCAQGCHGFGRRHNSKR
jgi:hypothetical protein